MSTKTKALKNLISSIFSDEGTINIKRASNDMLAIIYIYHKENAEIIAEMDRRLDCGLPDHAELIYRTVLRYNSLSKYFIKE